MDPIEIIALIVASIVAFYGAVVSTILGINELLKTRRKVELFLEYVAGYEKYRLIVVNIGYRPITITSVAIGIYRIEGGKKVFIDGVPANALFSADHEPPSLPITLKDGEQAVFWLTAQLTETKFREEDNIGVIVFDAEGREFKTYKEREFDAKWGSYYKD